MNTRKKIVGLLILSVIGFGIGYVLTNSIQFNMCTVNKTITEASCINFYERVGDPLLYGMTGLAFIFLILTFIPNVFSAWKKFAIWFIPLAILLFIFYPEPVFRWVSILYVVISIFIIFKSLKKEE